MVEKDAVEVIRCGPADLGLLREIGLRSFVEAFAAQNNPADFEAYILKAFDPKQLLLELENPASAF